MAARRAERRDIQRLVGRAILEPKFARELLRDPKKAAASEQISLSDKEAEVLKVTGLELLGAADRLDRTMKAAGDTVAFVDIHKH